MFTYFSKKLTFKNPYVILFQRVYILPLRNENTASISNAEPDGMNVYILPLRNENYPIEYKFSFSLFVYILPLRNENIKKASLLAP